MLHPSFDSFAKEKSAFDHWLVLAKAEEKFLVQRSRVRSITDGDCCTAYFHRIVSSKRANNHIPYLSITEATKLSSNSDIQQHCVEFFKGMLGTASPKLSKDGKHQLKNHWHFRCNPETKELLSKPVTPEEIKREFEGGR